MRLSELTLRRGTLLLATLYVAAALIGHARERSGAISCGCHPDC
jgi:hypothetical protein